MGQQKTIECKVERLTSGPTHHLFGFHDLIISNKSDDKYLCLEVDIINRPPMPGELFGVGYVKDGEFIKLGETTALNYPQGARQQWVADTELFTVNNRIGDAWGTDLYDAAVGKLLDRFPSATHMLSKDGKLAYGLDYARLYRLGGYGYSGITDIYAGENLPTKAGITVMDMQTKDVKLLVSVKQVAECGSDKVITSTPHYLTHLCLNPSSTRLAFLHRYTLPDGGGMTRLMTVGVDGSNLRCIAQGFLSHFDWKNDEHIYIFGRAGSSIDALRSNPLLSNPIIAFSLKYAKKAVKLILNKKISGLGKSFIMITDADNPVIVPYATDIIQEDGHPMTNPLVRSWCVSDTYPNDEGIRTLMLYNFDDCLRLDLGTFRMLDEKPDQSLIVEYFKGVDSIALGNIDELSFTRNGLHCDLHPRWNSKGDKVVFDSIHEGTRQVYCVDVKELIFNE